MLSSSASLLLSTAYFPPVSYFSLMEKHRDVYIEKHENYCKQSYRNRCCILSANGILPLIIPVKRYRGSKTPITKVRPDNSYNWQRLHLISIESAYRSSPFFEYYFDEIRPFFENKFDFLLDLNCAILDNLLSLLNIRATWQFTSSYLDIHQGEITDMRGRIHPKASKNKETGIRNETGYIQVFGDRYGFQENLSILDLLFNTGPDAVAYLKKSG